MIHWSVKGKTAPGWPLQAAKVMVPSHKDLGKSPQTESVVGRRTFQKKTCLKALSHTFLKIVLVNIYEYRGGSQSSPTLHSSVLNTLSARCSCTSPVYAIDLLEVGHLSPRLGWPARLTRVPEHRWTALDRVMQRGVRRHRLAIDFQRRSLYHPRLWYPICLRVGPRMPIWDEKNPRRGSHVIALWTHGAGPFQSHPRRNECPRTLPSPVATIYPLAKSFRALRWKMKWTCGDGGISLMRKHVKKWIEAAGPHLATVKLFHP